MTILGKIRFNITGDWDSVTNYRQDDIAYYRGNMYRCTANSNNDVPTTGINWELMIEKPYETGSWSNVTAYEIGDVVSYENATWICVQAHTNQTPIEGVYWNLMSEGSHDASWAFRFPSGSGQIGWGKTTARPGDSFEDGGKGFAKTGTGAHSHYDRISYINQDYGFVSWGGSSSNSSGRGDNNSHTEPHEMCFVHNEWRDGSLPTPDGEPPKIIQAEVGAYQGMVLFNNGEVHHWGYGGHGQGGNGDVTNDAVPVRCGYSNINRAGATTALYGKKAIRIAMSSTTDNNSTHSCYALIDNGDATNTLYSWGYNGYGQLGLGDVTSRDVPTAVVFDTATHGQIVDIWSGGGSYTTLYILTDQGKMFSCGYSGNGQMGTGSTASTNSTLTFVKEWGVGQSRISKFSFNHSESTGTCAVVTDDGQLWTWGYNNYGQCGHDHTTVVSTPTQVTYIGGDPVNDVQNVWMTSDGGYGIMYVTRGPNNDLYACGYNGYYGLSRYYADADLTHANAGNAASGWDTYRLQPVSEENNTQVTNVKYIECWGQANSYNAFMAITFDDKIYAGGWQGNGHFGLGHSDSYNARAHQCLNNTSNNLCKDNLYFPAGYNPKKIKPLAMGFSGTFMTLWYDEETGDVFVSGGSSGYTQGYRNKNIEAIAKYIGV